VSVAKKRQTFGKMQRERERAEKRARKQEKKEERKAAALAEAEAPVGEELGHGTPEEPSNPEQTESAGDDAADSASPPDPV
jgi:hypothetical protein